MSWKTLEDAVPEMATFGLERLSRVAYLATVRRDGGPRVHPVTPIIGGGAMFVFMEPTSYKGHDLRRDPRYALHASVEDSSGGQGEFWVHGQAKLVEDPERRQFAIQHSSYKPADRYILFELSVERAAKVLYTDNGPLREEWPPKAK